MLFFVRCMCSNLNWKIQNCKTGSSKERQNGLSFFSLPFFHLPVFVPYEHGQLIRFWFVLLGPKMSCVPFLVFADLQRGGNGRKSASRRGPFCFSVHCHCCSVSSRPGPGGRQDPAKPVGPHKVPRSSRPHTLAPCGQSAPAGGPDASFSDSLWAPVRWCFPGRRNVCVWNCVLDEKRIHSVSFSLFFICLPQLRLGSLRVVVLGGFTTTRQALVRQGDDFAGRPELFTFSAVADGNSMTFSEKYGPAWLLHKKLCKNALRSFSQAEPRGSGAACLLEEHICAEATEMVEVIWEQTVKDSDIMGIDPSISLVTCVANVVCALCFGRRYNHDDEEFLTIVNINNEVLKLFAAGNLADFFPVFRYLPSPSLRKLVQYIHRMNGFMERRIEEHINTFDKVKKPTYTLHI